jgi:hypothetical protein
MNARISGGYCPDCGYRGFVFGPRGGNSMNIECGNRFCRARFNIAQFINNHRVVYSHRIPKRVDGGADWGNDPE